MDYDDPCPAKIYCLPLPFMDGGAFIETEPEVLPYLSNTPRGQELWLEIREPIVNIYTDRVDGKRTGNIKGRWFFVNFELVSDTQRIAFDFDYAYTQAGDFDAFLQILLRASTCVRATKPQKREQAHVYEELADKP